MALLPRRRPKAAPSQKPPDEPVVVVRLGFPTDCPVCGGRGYLDHIDLTRKTQRQHCLTCGREWELSETGEIDLRHDDRS